MRAVVLKLHVLSENVRNALSTATSPAEAPTLPALHHVSYHIIDFGVDFVDLPYGDARHVLC